MIRQVEREREQEKHESHKLGNKLCAYQIRYNECRRVWHSNREPAERKERKEKNGKKFITSSVTHTLVLPSLDDHVRDLLCQSVDGALRVARRQEGEGAGVDDAQAVHAEHFGLAVDNVHFVDALFDAVLGGALAHAARRSGVPDRDGAFFDRFQDFLVAVLVEAGVLFDAGV
jgi:hypothetical protein